MPTAPILSINRHRLGTDGFGIHTLVAFSGCPLRCKYCINKRSWDESKAKNYSVPQLVEKVKVDDLYFQSTGGGITFGGGEPLLYPDFIVSFIKEYPTKVSFDMETSLNVPEENLRTVLPYIDHFYVDIKTLDKDAYHDYTGGELEQAWRNLMLLKRACQEKVIVRVPFIENYTSNGIYRATLELLDRLELRVDAFRYQIRGEKLPPAERIRMTGAALPPILPRKPSDEQDYNPPHIITVKLPN